MGSDTDYIKTNKKNNKSKEFIGTSPLSVQQDPCGMERTTLSATGEGCI